MNANKYIIVFIGAIALSFAGISAQPCGGMGPGGGPGMGGGGHGMRPGPGGGPGPNMDVDDRIDRLSYRLKLTDDQKKKAKEIFTEYQKRMDKLFEEIPERNKELRELFNQDTLDLKAIRAKMEEISKIHVDMRMMHVEQHAAFEKILTDEQKSILNQRRNERMGLMGPGPDEGGGPGPGPGNGRGKGGGPGRGW